MNASHKKMDQESSLQFFGDPSKTNLLPNFVG